MSAAGIIPPRGGLARRHRARHGRWGWQAEATIGVAIFRKPTSVARGAYISVPLVIRRAALLYAGIVIVAAGYGYGFATWGVNDLYVPFALPLVVLAGLAIWLMPAVRRPPIILLDRLFVWYLFALLAWPDYLAIALPGLPWISAVRLVGIPLLVTLLVCVRGSAAFRAQLADIFRGDRLIVRLMIVFAVYAAGSIALSHNIGVSASKFAVACLAWFAAFVASCHYFSRPGRPARFTMYLTIILTLCMVVGLYEAVHSQLPWTGRVPSLFRIDSPSVQRLLDGSFRAASGVYRVQSKFSTSIGFGEFMALACPFLLHTLVDSRRLVVRAIMLVLLAVMFYLVLRTDSRLAFIGYCASILAFVFAAALLRWRRVKDSIVATAVLVAYPAVIAVFFVLSLVWRRLHNLVWGGGAQQFSSQSRHDQWDQGIPMILHNPIGHGIGMGANTLKYIAFGGFDFYTIDSYYLSVLLEFGVIGFLVYYGMFAAGIWRAGWSALGTRDRDVLYLVPAGIALVNFMISKSVYSQTENHALAFILLGMIVALACRAKDERSPA